MTATIPILCYHAVSAGPAGSLGPWVVTPARFERHLDAIAEAGYRPITVGDMVAAVHERGEAPSEGTIVLTFDDGFADVHDEVLPRLAARGWAATVYVTTGLVGQAFHDRPMLDRRRIQEIAAGGFEIGAHGHHHLALDLLGLDRVAEEVERSRDLLASWIGEPVTTFAYPYGYHSDRVRQLVVDAGYASACAVKQALSSSDDDRFALARLMLRGDLSAGGLLTRLTSPRTRVAAGGRERPVTTAWRAFRRARLKTVERQS